MTSRRQIMWITTVAILALVINWWCNDVGVIRYWLMTMMAVIVNDVWLTLNTNKNDFNYAENHCIRYEWLQNNRLMRAKASRCSAYSEICEVDFFRKRWILSVTCTSIWRKTTWWQPSGRSALAITKHRSGLLTNSTGYLGRHSTPTKQSVHPYCLRSACIIIGLPLFNSLALLPQQSI